MPQLAKEQLNQEYTPDIPRNDLEVARLRQTIGVMALKFAEQQGKDELSTRRFAKNLASADAAALVTYKTLLKFTLYPQVNYKLEKLAQITEVTDEISYSEPINRQSRQKREKNNIVWRVPYIVSTPEDITEPQDIVNFYFPAEKGEQIDQIAKFALDLELDIQNSPHRIPKNLSRAMVLLLKSKDVLIDKNNDSQTGEIINRIDNTLGLYMDKTTPFVIHIVSKLNNKDKKHSLELRDLVTEGQIGFMDSLKRFDLRMSENCDPTSWCYHRILGQAKDGIRKNGSMITQNRLELKKIEMLKQKIADGKELTDKELQQLQDISDRLARSDVTSLDEPVSEDEGDTKIALIADQAEFEQDYGIDLPDINVDVLVSKLADRDQQIIRMRYGLAPFDDKNEGNGYTLQQIAAELGISESRISQLLQHKIMPKLEELLGVEHVIKNDLAEKPLSARELQILEFVSNGVKLPDIEDELSTAYDTTRSHMRNILRKLSVKNRHHAVAVAYKNNLLPKNTVEPANVPKLTDRKLELIKKLADGRTKEEVALELSIAGHTVKSHIRDILVQLNAKTMAHAVYIACEAGLLE